MNGISSLFLGSLTNGMNYQNLFANIASNVITGLPSVLQHKVASRRRPLIKPTGLGERLMETRERLATLKQNVYTAEVLREANTRAASFIHSRAKNGFIQNEYVTRTMLNRNYGNANRDIKFRAMEQDAANMQARVAKIQGDVSIQNDIIATQTPGYNPYTAALSDMFVKPMIQENMRDIGNAIKERFVQK